MGNLNSTSFRGRASTCHHERGEISDNADYQLAAPNQVAGLKSE
jgi:hypothetical protein